MNLNKTFVAVQDASRNMLALSDKEINQILLAVADAAINKTDFILSENQKDLERMPWASSMRRNISGTWRTIRMVSLTVWAF